MFDMAILCLEKKQCTKKTGNNPAFILISSSSIEWESYYKVELLNAQKLIIKSHIKQQLIKHSLQIFQPTHPPYPLLFLECAVSSTSVVVKILQ